MSTVDEQPLGWIRFWKPKDDWYYLEPLERKAYLDRYERVVIRYVEKGAQRIGTYRCRGQSIWSRFEVWEFPNLQMLIDLTNELEEIGYFQYFAAEHTVGRRYPFGGNSESWII